MAKPLDFDIHQVIADMQGTCSMLIDALPEGMNEDDLTSEDHEAIDNEIFLCDECGWWCEISEQADTGEDEQKCEDCHGDN